jgi:proteic killer suppression protein
VKVEFINKGLEELYTKGTSKKFSKVPPEIARKLVRAVDVLESSSNIQDIWKFPAYKFEKLEGNERYSMRLNRRWRLELTVRWVDDTKNTVDVIKLVDLTPHYKE